MSDESLYLSGRIPGTVREQCNLRKLFEFSVESPDAYLGNSRRHSVIWQVRA